MFWKPNQEDHGRDHNSHRTPGNPSLDSRRVLKRCTIIGLAALAAAGLIVLSSGNQVAACRDSGTTIRNSDGTSTTRWSDGAYVKNYPDGSYEWAYPAGTPPVPGASPGHNPYR